MPNPRESWSISVEKDYLKFSAAHFLIFPDGTAERLHGHNYKVYVDLHTELDEHGLVVNFKEIKPLVRQLCDELDEHLLIPGEHPRREPISLLRARGYGVHKSTRDDPPFRVRAEVLHVAEAQYVSQPFELLLSLNQRLVRAQGLGTFGG